MTDPEPLSNPMPTADPSAEVPPKSVWQWITSHAFTHRPFYLWLPLAVLAVVGAIHGYTYLSGRAPIDDAPVGAAWRLILAVVVVVLVNNVKPRLFDDIDTRDKTLPWWRVAIDTFETCFLLAFFGWFFLH